MLEVASQKYFASLSKSNVMFEDRKAAFTIAAKCSYPVVLQKAIHQLAWPNAVEPNAVIAP